VLYWLADDPKAITQLKTS